MKIRTLFVFGLAALAAFGAAQGDKVKVTPTPKAGDIHKYKVEISLNVTGAEAKVKANLVQTVTSVEGDKIKDETKWDGLSIELNGTPMEGIEAAPSVATYKLSGQLLEFTGGIQGTDAPRMHLFGIFVPPTKELAKDEKDEVSFDANSDKTIPARKYETTFLGKETVNGKDLLKFKVKYSEKEPGGMGYEVTYWLTAAGVISKAEGAFTELFIPQAGATSTGTFKLESAD